MTWDIKVGKQYVDALGIEMRIVAIEDGSVYYATQLDENVRDLPVEIFQIAITAEIKSSTDK
ncbi:hypothetical protein FHS18_005358 [Paenibacillus phyllosphaerae]|uniref:Uncharacterized protein n=1 Tax=Paenibacillus phyllosphaerae TaxID=274593 RepID=A0A7W5B2I4_9BACL|nr:hypothetical protein [Paenibacillus phyllosphaerae]MBB3113255.1 hypothetical protein [Paenibacillus phyllosphaerae]